MTHAAEPDLPEPEPIAPDPGPTLQAQGLGLRGKSGWVFRNLTLTLPPGTVANVCGPAGSGRSMALLALSGRAAVTEGTLAIGSESAPAAIRRRIAVARVGGASGLEPDLRVADHVAERRLLGGTGDVGGAAAALGVALRPGDLVGDLGALDALLCAVALAAMDLPAAIVVDDVDLGLDDRERAFAWQGLHGLAALGVTVIASAAEAAHTGAVVTHLLGSE